MSLLVAGRAERYKVVRVIAVQQVSGSPNAVELQNPILLTTVRAGGVRLFVQAMLKMAHFGIVKAVQANMKEQPGDDQSEDA